MNFKFLYIDDASDQVTKGLAERLSSKELGLLVEYKHVSIFDKFNIQDTIGTISQYQGLILDLRLDNEPYDGKNFPFTATEFAQHIRTLTTKGELKTDIPIIIFSTEAKLKDIYFKDMTSNNLFDRFIMKTQISDLVSKKLYSLANGYKKIAETKDFENLLQTNLKALDERFFSRFKIEEIIPVHEYAQVILKDLIYVKGFLINEQYLAARLGIDIDKSGDWSSVKKLFEEAKYTGVFSDGWNRWWMHKIDEIFEKIANTYLSYLSAKDKVEIFKSKGIKNIVFPEPIQGNSSYRFWTVCKALEKPLDPIEGFKVYTRNEPKPWQEYEYISLEALLHPYSLQEKNIKPHPSELDGISFAIKNAKKQ